MRQKIFKLYNSTPGFLLRDLRGESIQGVHRRLEQPEFLDILHRSKFCLAPAGTLPSYHPYGGEGLAPEGKGIVGLQPGHVGLQPSPLEGASHQ